MMRQRRVLDMGVATHWTRRWSLARGAAWVGLLLVILSVVGCGGQNGPLGSGVKKGGKSAQTEPPIKLSAGVALPQTLPVPSGQSSTVIMCSVDYRWTRAEWETGASYFWRIEWSGGRHADIPVDLRPGRGNRHTILREVRPEEGPFSCRIVVRPAGAEGEPRTISNVAAMR